MWILILYSALKGKTDSSCPHWTGAVLKSCWAVGVALTQRDYRTEVNLSPSCVAIPLIEIKRHCIVLHCTVVQEVRCQEICGIWGTNKSVKRDVIPSALKRRADLHCTKTLLSCRSTFNMLQSCSEFQHQCHSWEEKCLKIWALLHKMKYSGLTFFTKFNLSIS